MIQSKFFEKKVSSVFVDIFRKYSTEIFDFFIDTIPVAKVKTLPKKYPKHILLNYINFFLENCNRQEYLAKVFKKYDINLRNISEVELKLIEEFLIKGLKELFEQNWNHELESELKNMYQTFKKISA